MSESVVSPAPSAKVTTSGAAPEAEVASGERVFASRGAGGAEQPFAIERTVPRAAATVTMRNKMRNKAMRNKTMRNKAMRNKAMRDGEM
ncbi:hypothetical protein CQ042_18345 [Microbacterium sp. MYb62]|nr:hypothetical protein CQ042_18345 [Microbacterium sp. MYb62]